MCPFLLWLPCLALPVGAAGAPPPPVCLLWASVLLIPSWCLEVVLACAGCFGTEAAFYVLP